MNYSEAIVKAKEQSAFCKMDTVVSFQSLNGDFHIGMAWDHLTYEYETLKVVAVIHPSGQVREKGFLVSELTSEVA